MIWNNWRLYSEALPYTETGNYVIEAHCENDAMAAYVEVAPIDYCETGDVDHNGTVDINDVNALINMLLFDTSIATGDVNHDGTVDINDVSTLISILLGQS